MIRYDIALNEVTERIKANNLNVGAQFSEKNNEDLIVRSVGLALGIDDLESIVIKSENGRPIYLRDIADVQVGGAIRRGVQTLNGEQEVVAGMVVKLYGANSSIVIERVENKIEEINKILPDGIRIVSYYQQKELVEKSVSTITDALIQRVGLVALVLMVFMGGFRSSI
ncbi:MAG: efflux RND transporter permease subunit, partial [Candidatus Hinthialibacter sp.]